MAASLALRTTVIGSFPVPDWLKVCPTEQAFRDAVALVLRAQERAGIEVISDGELTRWDFPRGRPGGMVERFIAPLEGISTELSWRQRRAYRGRADLKYRADPAGVVVRALGPGRLDLGNHWEIVTASTATPLKFTITSPYMLAKIVQDEHYFDLRQLSFAFADLFGPQLAELDAAVVQVDEPNLPGTPEDAPVAAEAINRMLRGVKAQKAVHICFGNFGGQTIQQSHYRRLLEFINQLEVGHILIETTRRTEAELEYLRAIRPDLHLGLGVIDVKDLQIESPDLVARRIEAGSKLFGLEKIGWVHPDCGLQHLPRPIAERKLSALVQGRDLFLNSSACKRQPPSSDARPSALLQELK